MQTFLRLKNLLYFSFGNENRSRGVSRIRRHYQMSIKTSQIYKDGSLCVILIEIEVEITPLAVRIHHFQSNSIHPTKIETVNQRHAIEICPSDSVQGCALSRHLITKIYHQEWASVSERVHFDFAWWNFCHCFVFAIETYDYVHNHFLACHCEWAHVTDSDDDDAGDGDGVGGGGKFHMLKSQNSFGCRHILNNSQRN